MVKSIDYKYDLPTEPPAMCPPTGMLSLKSASHQGYSQIISINASRDSQGAGFPVQDVLRVIYEGPLMPRLKRDENSDKLSKVPRRIDSLCSRERFQILPEHSPGSCVLLRTSTPRRIFVS